MELPKLASIPLNADSTKKTQLVKSSAKDTTKEAKKAVEAAEQFETMLSLQLVQGMQKSLENGSLFGESSSGQMYGSLSDWELAHLFQKSAHLGLKEKVLQQIKPEGGGQ